jgi:PKD repeat protein
VADPVNCPITAWLWTFTDQGGLQSNAQFPAPVQYGGNPNALHPVTLTVTNDGGSGTITKSTP